MWRITGAAARMVNVRTGREKGKNVWQDKRMTLGNIYWFFMMIR
jgi:hypothetical protein